MTEKQLQVIVGLLAGMQTANVHLANVLCHKTGISHDDLASSFEETAEAIPASVANRELMQIVLRQISSGIRNAGAGGDFHELMHRLLH
ncbi:MAG: hypothetical protein PHD37_17635 [Gallionellaceae bacterium]|nr:hypothetical protein [Gallionellaceae bacterium]